MRLQLQSLWCRLNFAIICQPVLYNHRYPIWRIAVKKLWWCRLQNVGWSFLTVKIISEILSTEPLYNMNVVIFTDSPSLYVFRRSSCAILKMLPDHVEIHEMWWYICTFLFCRIYSINRIMPHIWGWHPFSLPKRRTLWAKPVNFHHSKLRIPNVITNSRNLSLNNARFPLSWLTPLKFNMEPENDGVQKESPFPGADLQVPC